MKVWPPIVKAAGLIYTDTDRLAYYTGGAVLTRPNLRVKSLELRSYLSEAGSDNSLERSYADSHISRLMDNTAQSIETSSLHLDLISDLKRINSHICSIAYPILEQAGVLAKTRLKEPLPAPPPDASASAPDDKPGWQKRKPHAI